MSSDLATGPGARTGGLRVLIVDDNRDAADSLALLVRCWGHDARVAYDGGDVLAQADAYRPDALLLDIGLPTVDGYTLARQVRERAGPERAVLIAVTGFGGEAQRTLAAKAGFDHFLLKPADLDLLRDLLTALLAARKQECFDSKAAELSLVFPPSH